MTRTTLALSFVAATAFGVTLAWLFEDAPETSRSPQSNAVEKVETASLGLSDPQVSCPDVGLGSEELARERARVAQLEQELERRLDALHESMPKDDDREATELEICMAAMQKVAPKPHTLDLNRADDQSFDSQALASSGIAPEEIAWIRERWEQARMKKLFLADQLARGEPTYPGENYGEIEQSLREDLGDDRYDAMLYATRTNNRVALKNVLGNSPAYEAGLRNGRVIHSYDGQRIFRPTEINALTRVGRPGELVAIEVVSDGGIERYFVERGPLGALFVSVRRQPTH